MKASGAIILARARDRGKSERGFVNDEVVNTLQIQDVEAEQRKYNNFWVGIQRRIAMKKANIRADDSHINIERAKKTKTSKYIIHPLSSNKVMWDLMVCCLVIYSVIVIPLRIGFNRQPSLGFIVFDDIIDCLFFLDMCATFNTAYMDAHLETYVYARKKIALNYMKFWFWIDFVSTVPFDDVVQLFASSHSQLGAIRAVRILRLGRLAKLQRLNKLQDYLEEQFSISPSQMNLVMLMLQIFFVAHVFACFWHFLALPSTTTARERTWITEGGFEDDSPTIQYIAALYYTIVTMLTVGYGDIHPTNPSERAYSVFTMLSGGVIFGALLSKVASVIEKRHPQARAFKENMDEVRAFLEEYSLPLNVKAKAKEAYSYYLTKKSSFGESGIFDDLPQPLLFKLVLQLYEKDIKKVQMFCSYECSFVVTLVINCKPFQAVRGEVIFNQGDVCKELVFVPSGMVRLSITTGSGKDVLAGFCTESGYFGDMEFLRNSIVTLAQYSAMTNCEFLSVSYQVVRQAIAENLDSGTNFNAEMTRRYAGFVKVTKSAVLGEMNPARASMRNSMRGRTSATNLNTNKRNSVNGGGEASVRNLTTRASSAGKYTPGQRRHSSTAGATSSIWLNGHLRDHRESAHYIRMALRHSSDNLSEAARRRLNELTPHGAHDGSDNTDSILSMANDEDDDTTSCKVLMKDEDGTQLIVDISHEALHHMFLIDPKESWKVRWDLFIAVIIVYTVIITPVEMAFYDKEPPKSFEVELVLDGMFFLDLAFSFRTSFPSNVESALVVDSWVIAQSYFKTWFTIDFLSSIPYNVVFEGLFTGDSLKSVKLIKALRLFRLMKLARIFKLEVFISKLEDTLGLPRSIFELLQVLIEVFFIGHLVACLWWGVSDGLSENPWFTNTDMVYEDMRHAPTGQKYLISLYFTFTTMTTVGYGDISATNAGEMLLNILIILMGASVFGYIIANVSTIVEGFNRVESVQSNRISVIKEYLGEKNCPDALEKKVVAHFKHLFSITSAYNVDKIMSRLPPSLRDEILYFHNEIKMRNIPIFRYLNNRSLALHIFHLLTPVFYEVDQYIIKQGRESGEINFIVIGTACAFRMEQKKKTVPKKSRPRARHNVMQNMNMKEEQQYMKAREAFLEASGGPPDGPADVEGEGTGISLETADNIQLGPMPMAGAVGFPPKMSFEEKVDPSSPRDYEETVLTDTGSQKNNPSIPMMSHIPLRTRASFVTLAANVAETTDADKPANFPTMSAMNEMDEWEKENHGLELIGDFSAGDFVGHAGLMKDAPHDCSVVATSACTVFVLTKAVIYKLIHSEAVVGLKLQEALGSAISAQAQNLGRSHRRHNRAEFLRDLKDKVFEIQSKKDPTSVRSRLASLKESRKKFTSTLSAIAKESVVSSSKGKGFFDDGSGKGKLGKGVSILDMKSSPDKPRVVKKGISMRVSLVKNARRFQSIRRHMSFKAKISPIAEAEEESGVSHKQRPLIKRGQEAEAVRKMKKVDHLLNDQTMLYDSDEEDRHNAHKEQAIAHFQRLVRLNSQLHHSGIAETPKQKLQRLLRRALRQHRRNKNRKALIAKSETANNLAGIESRPHFDRHRLTLHDDKHGHGHGHGHGSPAGSLISMVHTSSGGRGNSFSEKLTSATGGHHLTLSMAGRLARNLGYMRPATTEHWDAHRHAMEFSVKSHAGPGSHKMQDFASMRSGYSSSVSGQGRQWSSAIHSVSFGLSAIAAQHLPSKSYLTRHEMGKIKKYVDRRRRWSLSAIEDLIHTTPPISALSPGKKFKQGASFHQSHGQSRKVVNRVRRQSFPSQDNDAWRDSHTYVAVL